MRRLFAPLLVAGCLAGPPSTTAEGPKPGNWTLTTVGPVDDDPQFILKLDRDGNAWKGSVLAKARPMQRVSLDVKSVDVAGGRLRVILDRQGNETILEGVSGADENVIRGSLGGDERMSPVALVWTEESTIDDRVAGRKEPIPPIKQINDLQASLQPFSKRFREAKSAEDKQKVLDEYNVKVKENEPIVQGLHRKVLAEHADHPAAYFSAMSLLRGSTAKSPAADVKSWVDAVTKKADEYGPRFGRYILIQAAELAAQNPDKTLAADIARRADRAVGPDGPAAWQYQTQTLLAALPGGGDPARLEAAERKLAADMTAKWPKLETAAFSRKNGDGRVVLVELFTGAQCPPCVASDLAFDALTEIFKPADVVSLQYHLHIPGPDPLTNADTEARWEAVQKAFPENAQGTPTTFFNGKPGSVISESFTEGGGADRSPVALAAFRKMIEPLLEEPAKAKLDLRAGRSGDSLTLSAAVEPSKGVDNPVKLRFALIEDVVRYRGGNGLMYHHHVVRAMPGGAAGFDVPPSGGPRDVTVNLAELRGGLTKYLDAYAQGKSAFPKPNRPMELKNLKAVAWLQDDKTHEVLNAAQVDVPGR